MSFLRKKSATSKSSTLDVKNMVSVWDLTGVAIVANQQGHFSSQAAGRSMFPVFFQGVSVFIVFFQHFLPHVFPATAFFTVWKPFGRTRLFGLAKKTGIYILVRRCPLDFKIFYQTVPNICTIFMFTYFEKDLWASGIFGLILQSLILRHMGSCWNLKFWKYGKYGKLL